MNAPELPAPTTSSGQQLRAQRYAPLVALAVLAGLTWWLRAPLHAMPLERDEGAYATIAARLLAGDVLYRDLFDHKPPLTHLVFTLAALAPGDPIVAVRALATCYLLATGLGVFALGRRMYGTLAGAMATALVLAYGSSRRFQGLSFNTEAVMALPATLGCLLAVSAILESRARRLLGAGLCVSLALLAKPVGLALVGPLLLAPVLARWPARRAAAGGALALVGVSLPVLVTGVALALQGALGATSEALLDYNKIYTLESLELGWTPAWLWRIWEPMLALALPALLGLVVATPAARSAGAGSARPALQPPRLRLAAHATVALWGAALVAGALLSLRPYPHYYLASVPLLSVWAGAGLGRLARLASSAASRAWPGLLVGCLATAAIARPALAEVLPLRSLEPRAQITALYDWDGPEFFAPAADVAAYAAAYLPADAALYVWAAEPQIYYLSRHPPAARFVYDYPVDRLPGARDELLATLRNTPPQLIVTYRNVRPIGVHPFFDDYGYRHVATIGGYELFARGERAP